MKWHTRQDHASVVIIATIIVKWKKEEGEGDLCLCATAPERDFMSVVLVVSCTISINIRRLLL
jgi:hypothetical protein